MTTATVRLVRPVTWREPQLTPANKTAAFDSEAAELPQLETLLFGLAEVPFAPLAGPLHDALAATGDRVRGRVALAVGRAWHVKPAYRLALAAALETLYVASQVHEVLTRRVALNGSAGALVLMGDHLYARAAAFAAEAESPAIVTLFARTLQRLSENAVRQLLRAPGTLTVTTHALLCAAAAEGAAMLGQADPEETEALRQVGLLIDQATASRAALDHVQHPAARRNLAVLMDSLL